MSIGERYRNFSERYPVTATVAMRTAAAAGMLEAGIAAIETVAGRPYSFMERAPWEALAVGLSTIPSYAMDRKVNSDINK